MNELKRSVNVLRIHKPEFSVVAERAEAFKSIGEFLDQSIKLGGENDLGANSNDAVNLVEFEMSRALKVISNTQLKDNELLVWQMYNAGVIFQCKNHCFGVDVVPPVRSFGWQEPEGFCENIAELLDFLLITHRHNDHYDERLVDVCLNAKKQVYMPDALAKTRSPHSSLIQISKSLDDEINGFSIHARQGDHLDSHIIGSVPVVYYQVDFPNKFSVMHVGDLDYKKYLTPISQPPDIICLPWRETTAKAEEVAIDFASAANLVEAKSVLMVHFAELKHVYQGCKTAYDIAVNIKRQMSIPTEFMFFGECLAISEPVPQK